MQKELLDFQKRIQSEINGAYLDEDTVKVARELFINFISRSENLNTLSNAEIVAAFSSAASLSFLAAKAFSDSKKKLNTYVK